MTINKNPIFTGVPSVQWAINITAANATIDLTTGTSYLAFTADSTYGSYVKEARIKTSPSANTAATVMRFWINNGSTTGTDVNSVIVGEVLLPSTTASATAPQTDMVYPLGFALGPGQKIYVTLGTAPGGSSEYNVAVIGGHYVAAT
jgi:hypothetical protein